MPAAGELVKRTARWGIVAATLALVLGTTTPAAAVPESGFGSWDDPMLAQHGSGLQWRAIALPMYRFFDPCAYFGVPKTPGEHRIPITAATRTIWVNSGSRRVEQLDQWYRLDERRISVYLTCTTVAIPPYKTTVVQADCPGASLLRDTRVDGSLGYSHRAGPIVVPSHQRGWHGFTNIGWVDAEVSVWWACTE